MTVEFAGARAHRAADAAQAASFRACLVEERKAVALALVDSLVRLRACTEGEVVVGLRGMARARLRVRELQDKQRELDQLISGLDRRFSALWAIEG